MSLSHEDLKGTIHPTVSIDEFEPNSGDNHEVIVVAFYAVDEEPATDLNRFIQRGHMEIIDTEISPNPDQDGNYLIFVEFARTPEFYPKFADLMVDIGNLTGQEPWQVSIKDSEELIDLDKFKIEKHIIADSGEYVEANGIKDDEMIEIEESLGNYFENSFVSNLIIKEGYVIFDSIDKIAGKIVGFGDCDTLLKSYYLNESAISLLDIPLEVNVLENILGDGWNVHKLDKFVAIGNEWSDNILLIENIQMVYT